MVWVAWLGVTGTVIYVMAMWNSGMVQGLMWRTYDEFGTLTYTFVESLSATYPYYAVRLLGGTLFFAGMLIMVYNVWRTIKGGVAERTPVMQPA